VLPELYVLPVWAAILLFPVVNRRRSHLDALSLNLSRSKTPNLHNNFLSSCSIARDKAIKSHIYEGAIRFVDVYTLCFKNVPHLVCYNFDVRQPNLIILAEMFLRK